MPTNPSVDSANDADRYKAIEAMAIERFGVLTPGEETLLRAVVEGLRADLTPRPPEPDKAKPDQKIRARLLRWLLTDSEGHFLFKKAQVFICGALIEDELNLEFAEVSVALFLQNCRITKPIVLRHARIRSLNLSGSHIAGISGDNVRVQGGILLRYGFVTFGEVRLIGARIEGDFSCSGGLFKHLDTKRSQCPVIYLDGAIIDGSIFFDQGFRSEGEVRFPNAKVGGIVDCRNGRFSTPDVAQHRTVIARFGPFEISTE